MGHEATFDIKIAQDADGTWSWRVSRHEHLHGRGVGLQNREECEVLARRHAAIRVKVREQLTKYGKATR